MHLESKVIDVTDFDVSKSTSSKGNQRKWSDGHIWVKAAFEHEGQFWKDYLVEIIAADIGDQLGFHVVPQGLAVIQLADDREHMGCWSFDFLPENYSFLSFYHLLKAHDLVRDYDKMTKQQPPLVQFQATVGLLRDITGLDFTGYLTEMVVLDFLVGNEDRHINNFGVLWCAETDEYAVAPLFDQGLGLFEHDPVYSRLTLTEAIRKMRGQPFNRNLQKVVDAVDLTILSLQGKTIDVSALTFPNSLALPYLKFTAAHLGIEVLV